MVISNYVVAMAYSGRVAIIAGGLGKCQLQVLRIKGARLC